MALTKKIVQDAHRSVVVKAAAAERFMCRREGCAHAARVLSSQEVTALPPVQQPAPRAHKGQGRGARARSHAALLHFSSVPGVHGVRRILCRGAARHRRRRLLQPPGMLTGVVGARQLPRRSMRKRRTAGPTRREASSASRCGSRRASSSPAASGCAYGSRRRPGAEADEAQAKE